MSTPTEYAWAAGFFDGEGCFTLRRGGHRYKTPIASISQSGSPELLERFRKVLGVGAITGPYPGRTANSRSYYSYHASGMCDLVAIGSKLWKWLGSYKKAAYTKMMNGYQAHRDVFVPQKPGPKKRKVA